MTLRAIIDDREALNHPLWLDDSNLAGTIPGTFVKEGYTPSSQRLTAGDLKIEIPKNEESSGGWVVFELKSWLDFISTLRDKGADRDDTRIRHQVAGLLALRDLGAEVVVLVVGDYVENKTGGGVIITTPEGKRRKVKSVTPGELEGALLALQRLGITHLRVNDFVQLPRAVRIAAGIMGRSHHFGDPGLARVSSLSPRLSELATLLTAIAGIGPHQALALARYFGTFSALSGASRSALEGVAGIGPSRAGRVFDFFQGDLAHDDPFDPDYDPFNPPRPGADKTPSAGESGAAQPAGTDDEEQAS
jgi:ERCC4-type nuclease